MTAHLSKDLIARYKEQALLPGEWRYIREHTASCEPCRVEVLDQEKLVATVRAEREEFRRLAGEELLHPATAELNSYVRSNLNANESEIIETHLEMCSSCAKTAEEIQSEIVTAYPPPIGSIDAVKREAGEMLSFAPNQRLTRKWLRPGFAFASLFVIITLLGVVILLSLRSNNSQQPASFGGAGEFTQGPTPLVPNTNSTPSPPQQNQGLNNNIDSLAGANGSDPSRQVRKSQARTRRPSKPSGKTNLIPGSNSPLETVFEDPNLMSKIRYKPRYLLGPENGKVVRVRPLSPIGTVIKGTLPTFKWSPVDGAASYRVTILDEELNPFIPASNTTSTELSIAAPLARGKVYTWQVTAIMPDGSEIPSTSAAHPAPRFAVLAGEKFEAPADGRSTHQEFVGPWTALLEIGTI